jgi:hypothetical protein
VLILTFLRYFNQKLTGKTHQKLPEKLSETFYEKSSRSEVLQKFSQLEQLLNTGKKYSQKA